MHIDATRDKALMVAHGKQTKDKDLFLTLRHNYVQVENVFGGLKQKCTMQYLMKYSPHRKGSGTSCKAMLSTFRTHVYLYF